MTAPASSPYRAREIIIKRPDGEMLKREDVQYDFLYHVFSDTKPVFTNPFAPATRSNAKVSFADLYLSTLRSSTRVTRTLIDLLNENRAFALEMAKLAFLINVGRLDTTMSFFPETKTAQRTYHPIPSLQRAPEDHHDGPRLKNYLKWVTLNSERESGPPKLLLPAEILARLNGGIRPPTHVFHLLFCLSHNAGLHSVIHLSEDKSLHYLDFFSKLPLSSSDRARAFLWYMYHYLEGGPSNPFDDDYSRQNPGKAPRIRVLSKSEAAKENVDTQEEIAWAKERTRDRINFLRDLKSGQDYQDRTKSESPVVAEYNVRRRWSTRFVPPIGVSKEETNPGPSPLSQTTTPQPIAVFEHYISPEHEQTRSKSHRRTGFGSKIQERFPSATGGPPTTFAHYIPPDSQGSQEHLGKLRPAQFQRETSPPLRPSSTSSRVQERRHLHETMSSLTVSQPYTTPTRLSQTSHDRRPENRDDKYSRHDHRYSTSSSHHPERSRRQSLHDASRHCADSRRTSSRTSHLPCSSPLQQLWPIETQESDFTRGSVEHMFNKIRNNRDDSDDEVGGDMEDRKEYGRRLAVMSRLRGRPPTPPAPQGWP